MAEALSLIITARGGPERLSACLRGLARDIDDGVGEIIVIDSRIGDKRSQEAAPLGRELFGEAFSMELPPPGASPCRARNMAAAGAGGERLFFLDGNCLFSPGWLRPLKAALDADPGLAALSPLPLCPAAAGQPERVLHAGLCLNPIRNPWPLCAGFPAQHPLSGKRRSVKLLSASCLMIRRKAFFEAGAFDEDKAPGHEDFELCARLILAGRSLLLEPEARIYLPEPPEEAGNPLPFMRLPLLDGALGQLPSDMEEHLRADGLALGLSPWLNFYAVPAQNPPLPAGSEPLSAFLLANPLCRTAYASLAAELAAQGRDEEAYAWRLTAARIFPDPEEFLDLYLAAGDASLEGARKKAGDLLEALRPSMGYMDYKAGAIMSWARDRGLESTVRACGQWFEERHAFRSRHLLPFIHRAAKAGLLSGRLPGCIPAYSGFDELRRDQAPQEEALVTQKLASLERRPLVSLLMPVYNPDPDFLILALNSILRQSYDNWQLCLADDASTDARIPDILKDFTRRDGRIKLALRKENGHICAASNTALAMADGEYAAFVDHDDELDRHALAHMVLALEANPGVRLLYSDEDKIGVQGFAFSPHFKTGFDPDLLLGENYFCHLTMYESALLREAGGLRPGFEGAQDHDLALRCIARLEANQVLHVPRLLYHWRAHGQSTARKPEIKPYASAAGLKAVSEHLKRIGRQAEVSVNERCATHYTVSESLPSPPPPVLLLAYCHELTGREERWASLLMRKNACPGLGLCLFYRQGQAAASPAGKVSFIRTEKDDVPPDFFHEHPDAVIGRVQPGIVPLFPDWAERLAAEASRPEVGAVGGRIWTREGLLESAGLGLTAKGRLFAASAGLERKGPGHFNIVNLVHATAFLSGDCLFARAACWRLFAGEEQNEFRPLQFCMRARAAGLRVLCVPTADMYRMSGHAPWVPPAPDDPRWRAFLERWQKQAKALALHRELAPVPGGYALAAFVAEEEQ
ncbi:glycosyltransferase [Desulfovibrio sp. OttesenSCG-928-G11]|nr:glycosyltransferase [Desulfovibrio sp. OttesenSCG-928-G11]